MRSSEPIPGNPWPHDMVITVEDDPQTLVDLLWIREAWKLHPSGDDLPPLLSDESVGAQARAASPDQRGTWQNAWPSIWDACVAHAAKIPDVTIFEQIHETENGSAERLELLNRVMGPTWRGVFGDEAFTDGYDAWNLARGEQRARLMPVALESEPERISLVALIDAWQAGLTKVVTIPCSGSYTRVIGDSALMVTVETREDPNRYHEALAHFRGQRPGDPLTRSFR